MTGTPAWITALRTTTPDWIVSQLAARAVSDTDDSLSPHVSVSHAVTSYRARIDYVDAECAHLTFPDMHTAASWAQTCSLSSKTVVKDGAYFLDRPISVIVDIR